LGTFYRRRLTRTSGFVISKNGLWESSNFELSRAVSTRTDSVGIPFAAAL
jgi:hypothetical protein